MNKSFHNKIKKKQKKLKGFKFQSSRKPNPLEYIRSLYRRLNPNSNAISFSTY